MVAFPLLKHSRPILYEFEFQKTFLNKYNKILNNITNAVNQQYNVEHNFTVMSLNTILHDNSNKYDDMQSSIEADIGSTIVPIEVATENAFADTWGRRVACID